MVLTYDFFVFLLVMILAIVLLFTMVWHVSYKLELKLYRCQWPKGHIEGVL